MRIVAIGTLRHFREDNRDSEQAMKSWYREVRLADWATPNQVKAMYRNASIVRDNRVVFNIAGNKYRLIVKFNYSYRIGYVRFIGTHAEYDQVNAERI